MSAVLRAVHAVTDLLVPQVDALPSRRPRPWETPTQAQRITFRFGLTGLRWGAPGPVVLLVHGPDARPAQFRHLIEALVGSGRQVVALDALTPEATPLEQALALTEAGVELPELEAVIGHGTGAAAAALALDHGLRAARAVLVAPPAGAIETARGLGVPGLVIHDTDDAEAPFADGAALADAWRGARFLATTGLGHWRVLGDANVVHGIAEFLHGHDAGLPPAQRLRASA